MKNKLIQRDLEFLVKYSDLSTYELAEKLGIQEQEVEREIIQRKD
jgi:hypothetical protein